MRDPRRHQWRHQTHRKVTAAYCAGWRQEWLREAVCWLRPDLSPPHCVPWCVRRTGRSGEYATLPRSISKCRKRNGCAASEQRPLALHEASSRRGSRATRRLTLFLEADRKR